MYTSLCRYLHVLPVLRRADVVGIFNFVGANTIKKIHAICQRDDRIESFLSIHCVHGDLCKHLGIDLSTDPIPIIRILL